MYNSSVVTAMERRILVVLEELREQKGITISLLQQLLSRSLSNVHAEDTDCNLPGGLVIPVHNVQELDHLNSEVADSDISGKLVQITCSFW